jgi:PleD family two-component response regulator
MVVAVVNDLMFTSKIRSAATQLGVTVTFARSRDAALVAIRDQRPSLVILDLNSSAADPLGLLAAVRSDSAIQHTPTVGFVSHVQAELVDAARAAGIGEVMARSAFTQRLPELLERGR